MEITTPRPILRPVRRSDLDDLFAVFSDPRAMAYWSTPPHESRARTADWIELMIDGDSPGPALDFIIEHEGRAVGKAGFWKPPEIGYILHPDLWGRGLAREALEAVIDRAFGVGGLTEVRADVDPRNAASLGLLARLGFERTGFAARTWNVGGVWCDSVYLTLKRPDGAA